nr:MAG TPA: hypothetical protein [Caudoviricetes sp.]
MQKTQSATLKKLVLYPLIRSIRSVIIDRFRSSINLFRKIPPPVFLITICAIHCDVYFKYCSNHF